MMGQYTDHDLDLAEKAIHIIGLIRAKYSDDEPRDENGRWSGGGDSSHTSEATGQNSTYQTGDRVSVYNGGSGTDRGGTVVGHIGDNVIVQMQNGGGTTTVSQDRLTREVGPTDKNGNVIVPGDHVIAERSANGTVERATVVMTGTGGSRTGDSIVVQGHDSGQQYHMPASDANNTTYGMNPHKTMDDIDLANKAIEILALFGAKYSEDEERDENGRWTGGGSSNFQTGDHVSVYRGGSGTDRHGQIVGQNTLGHVVVFPNGTSTTATESQLLHDTPQPVSTAGPGGSEIHLGDTVIGTGPYGTGVEGTAIQSGTPNEAGVLVEHGDDKQSASYIAAGDVMKVEHNH